MTCGFSCVINKHWCKNGDFDETHDLLPIFFKWRIGEWMMRGNLLLRIFSLTLLRVCWQSSCAGCNTFYNFLKVFPACPWTFQSLLYTATNELWQPKKPRFFLSICWRKHTCYKRMVVIWTYDAYSKCIIYFFILRKS